MKYFIVKTVKIKNEFTVTVSAKFHLNTCVDSENGKVDIYFKHFGLCDLVFSHLNL